VLLQGVWQPHNLGVPHQIAYAYFCLISPYTRVWRIRRRGWSFSGWGCVLSRACVSPVIRASPSTCSVLVIDWQVHGLCRCFCLTHVVCAWVRVQPFPGVIQHPKSRPSRRHEISTASWNELFRVMNYTFTSWNFFCVMKPHYLPSWNFFLRHEFKLPSWNQFPVMKHHPRRHETNISPSWNWVIMRWTHVPHGHINRGS